MSPGQRRGWLRSRLQEDPLVVAPGVFDALSARLVEVCGFEVAYASAASVGAVGGAWLLRALAGLEWGTALLAATPGGMPEMVLIALALDRPVDTVTAVQLVRVVTTLLVALPLVRLWLRRAEVEG